MDAAVATETPVMGTSRAAPDDRAEFDAFYAGNVGRITAQIRAYVGDHAEAEDVVAEAFTRAVVRWKTLSTYDNPAVWVRRVAWNLATSRLRRGAFARRFSCAASASPTSKGPSPTASISNARSPRSTIGIARRSSSTTSPG
ncbi:RNA polymerase sigma factor [Glycomyces sp. YM15]|uniref:RNA polymerase sigma factor n=1 Tax=Glycomyces sp. YM15 TaxID=2800446 RepID=UPI001963C415|nr:sigma factor [Glycomyces sp. YM15]